MFQTLHGMVMRRVALPIARRLAARGVTGNQVTATGLFVCLTGAFVVCAGGPLALAGILFLVGSFGDLLDGSIARLRGEASAIGGLFDSYADHLAETCFVGALILTLPDPIERIAAIAALSSLGASYVKPLAFQYGFTHIDWTTAHIVGRATRVSVLGLGLASTAVMPWPLVNTLWVTLGVLIVVNLVSIAHRITVTAREARKPTAPAGASAADRP